MTDCPPARPLRADALRNRERILVAARQVLAEDGLEAGFTEIARVAGVGVGSVYRRFPDRESLIDALFAEAIDQVAEEVQGALTSDDPGKAFWDHLTASIERRCANRGFAELLDSPRGRETTASAKERLQPLITELLDRAKNAGAVRAEVSTADIAVLMHVVSQTSTADHPDLWRRYLAIMADGLKPQSGFTLAHVPGAPDEWFVPSDARG
ncbi:MAG: TetR/AcrR family transcriptional regulator [Nocardioides sp.]